MKRKQYLYKQVTIDPAKPLELVTEGCRVVGIIPSDRFNSLLLEREIEFEDEPPMPKGQVERPTRTLWLRRENGDLYFVEKWRGIYDYEKPELPCLDAIREVRYQLDAVCIRWQRKMSLAAKYLMAKHDGLKNDEEFQFWLPGLADDEELLK